MEDTPAHPWLFDAQRYFLPIDPNSPWQKSGEVTLLT